MRYVIIDNKSYSENHPKAKAVAARITAEMQSECGHNRMVPWVSHGKMRWKCADCGYVYNSGYKPEELGL